MFRTLASAILLASALRSAEKSPAKKSALDKATLETYVRHLNVWGPQIKLHTDLQPSFGTPGAPVVIVLFSDFECPYCKEEAKALRSNLLATYPKEVRLYFKDLPLTQI